MGGKEEKATKRCRSKGHAEFGYVASPPPQVKIEGRMSLGKGPALKRREKKG